MCHGDKKGLIEQITAWKPNANRPRGRPEQRWTDRIKKILEDVGNKKCGKKAKDKGEWG